MSSSKDLDIKTIDRLIIPCFIDNKILCNCLPECLSREIIQFYNDINRIKNFSYSPSSTQGITSSQGGAGMFNYCPVRVPWKTLYQVETGKRLVLTPRQASALFDFMTTKKSVFGPIVKEVFRQATDKYYAKNRVYDPTSTQGITISQSGSYFSCTKTEHNYKRKVKSACHDNCCGSAKKTCSNKGTCRLTTCF
jgi:hypothetical protein